MVLLEGQNRFKRFSGLLVQLFVSVMLITSSQYVISEESVKTSHEAAIQIVNTLHENLLVVMQAADALSFTERYSKLEPIITKSFDTPTIAKVILSRYWKDLSNQQQGDFINLFNRQTVATYASRFDSYDDDVFKTKTIEELKKGRILVRTEIQRTAGKPINLDYLMHKNNGNWYIISVIADGVNDLSLKRAEYSTVIKENGYESLVTNIEKKVNEMENSGDK